MIVPMKKITLLTLAAEQEVALDILQQLGVMHVVGGKKVETPDRSMTASCLAQLTRLCRELASVPAVADPACQSMKEDQLLQCAVAIQKELDDLAKEAAQLELALEQLAPWGNFEPDAFAALEQRNWKVYCCELAAAAFQAFVPPREDMVMEVVNSAVPLPGKVLFVLLGPSLPAEELALLPLSPARFDRSPREIQQKLQQIQSSIAEKERNFSAIAAERQRLEAWALEVADRNELLSVRDGVERFDSVNAITGFVPVKEVARLQDAAHLHGWALLIEDPAEDDDVPTLLELPRWQRVVKPLMDFLGLAPGYREIDASGAVLVFFTIYFGIIVGDAGYGFLFLLASLWAWWSNRDKPAGKLAARFGILMSLATITWGALSGNYFGTALFPGIPLLTDANKDHNIQAFCFMLAMAQMSIGHLWQAFVCGSWKGIVGNLGWMLLLWGNGILAIRVVAFPGPMPTVMYALYGVGLVGVLIGGVDWKDFGSIFNLPFSLISSFVDVLSYIRLFAVGLAGYYIAYSFNDMGGQLSQIFPGAVVFGAIVILIGHALNLVLCLMGVLVHGVRLNTLEFAGHLGLGWSGFDFKPFKKNNK